ncbi:MAG: 3-oxoacyl-[acyl-carrier protein] reductase [Mycobacterium sp.]|jgi:3-oxoacyl-[acyl-carrier protein] reductase|nr:3-oxoacyl-[acyl-carrier protein] reductase [Mycobacterium sp.]
MDLGLTNATAIVVGGGRGMGLASARCLADDGARIAIIEQWSEAFDEGVMGMVRCVRAAPPLLRKAEWARIVNFSAHSTQRQSVILPAYTAAKAALTSVSKNLSLLLARTRFWSTSCRRAASPLSRWSAGRRRWASTAPIRTG